MARETDPAPLLEQVEETQEALRKSIEESKRLAEQSQELLDRFRTGEADEPR